MKTAISQAILLTRPMTTYSFALVNKTTKNTIVIKIQIEMKCMWMCVSWNTVGFLFVCFYQSFVINMPLSVSIHTTPRTHSHTQTYAHVHLCHIMKLDTKCTDIDFHFCV